MKPALAPTSPRSRGVFFLLWSCLVLALAVPAIGQEGSGGEPADGTLVTRIKILPRNNTQGVPLDRATTVSFSNAIRTQTITPQSIEVTSAGLPLATEFRFSIDRKVVTVRYPNFLPQNATIDVIVRGDQIVDIYGVRVDGNGDGVAGGIGTARFRTGAAAQPPVETGSAIVLGRVVDAEGRPIQGAVINGFDWPRDETRPHQVPSAISGPDGEFRYTTRSFTGQADYVIAVQKSDFSTTPPTLYTESLRRVQPLAGNCIRVADSILQPIAPRVMVTAASGGMLQDPAGQVTLEIPAGALMRDSMIGVTVLQGDDALRAELPERVARQGCFVDISGVFGEQTTMPVTMRVPNTYGLPPGTRVPFGKVDHNTLEWTDLRALAPGAPPDSYLGTVIANGTAIEVQFDHFCSICTGYCLPHPDPDPDGPPPPEPPDPPCGPGSNSGNSVVDLREGFLTEDVPLTRFFELEGQFALTLGYASQYAQPSVTLQATVDYNSTRPVERTRFRFDVAGTEVDAVYDFTSNRRKPTGTFFWDGVDGLGVTQPTGSYPYIVRITSLNAQTAVALPAAFGGSSVVTFGGVYPGLTELSAEVEGRAVLVNLRESDFGAGWYLLEEPRLYFDADATVVLLEGRNTPQIFTPDPTTQNLWVTPSHDASTMSFNPASGGFRRQFPDGEEQIFDSEGRVERIVDRYGFAVRFTRSGDRLTRVTSRTGQNYDFGYDAAGHIRSLTDSAGRTMGFVVDAAGDLTAVTDAVGATRTFSYDSEHLLIGQADARGARSEYTYQNGRITRVRAFDTDGTTLLRERNFAPSTAAGEIGQALADNFGTIARPIPLVASRTDAMTDGRGITTTHDIDDLWRTTAIRDGLGNATQFEYAPDGRFGGILRPNGWRTRYEYDADGNVTRLRQLNNTSLYSTTTYEYLGTFGQLSRTVDAENRETRYTYDEFGNLIEIRDHLGGLTRYFYEDPRFPNLETRLIGPGGELREFVYDVRGNATTLTQFATAQPSSARRVIMTRDLAGNVTSTRDSLQRVTNFTYDAANRVRSMQNHLGQTTTFEYGELGCGCTTENLTRVAYPDGTQIRYVYDGLDRLVERIDQLGNSSLWTYDPEGNLLTWQNRNGELVTYEYDDAGNRVRKVLPGNEVTTYQYDSLGTLTAAGDPACRLAFSYDFLQRELAATTELDLQLGTGSVHTLAHLVEYTYDRVGNRRTLQDSYGNADVDYLYDPLHRLTRVTLVATPSRRWDFGYDAGGGLMTRTTAPTGAASTWTRNLLGEIVGIDHATTSPIGIDYTHDLIGRVQASSLLLAGQTTDLSYTYDGADQLTRAVSTQQFGGSRVARTYGPHPANRTSSDGEFALTYDLEGNLVRRVRASAGLTEDFVYDAEGRLRRHTQSRTPSGGQPTQVLDVRYAYDPLGRRVEKNVNGVVTRWLYDGQNLLHELDALNRIDKSFVQGPGLDEPIALLDAVDDRILHYHQDHLGSIVALSNDAGVAVQSYVWDEYGNVLREADPSIGQPYGFTGRERDLETGLHHYRARVYDPQLGRFLREDPADIAGGANLYAYVQNDPLNYDDPLGLAPGLACNNVCEATYGKFCRAGVDDAACWQNDECKKKCQDQIDCVPYDCLYKRSPSCLAKTAWRCWRSNR